MTAPQPDYYFGPRIQGEEEYDPLESIPPPAGESPPRPDPPVTITCDATAPVGSICPFGFPPSPATQRPWLDGIDGGRTRVSDSFTHKHSGSCL